MITIHANQAVVHGIVTPAKNSPSFNGPLMPDEKNIHPIELAWRRARKALKGLEPESDLCRKLPRYLAAYAPGGLPEGVVFPSNLVIRNAHGKVIETQPGAPRVEQFPADQVPTWMSVALHEKDKISKDSKVDGGYLLSMGMAGRIVAQTAYAYAFWSSYRISKRIYRINPILWEGLAAAKFPANYPTPMLHLPAPAIALDLGEASVKLPTGPDKEVRFIFMNLDLAPDGESTGERALNIAIPFGSEDQLRLVASLNLDKHSTIQECWEACIQRWKTNYFETYMEQPSAVEETAYNQIVGGALNTLLYILGENEIAVTVHPGAKPELPKNRPANKVQRLAIDLARPEELEIGGQYAAKAIEHWGDEISGCGINPPQGVGRNVRPHIRSAHAHLYWTGQGKTVPVVKYLPPIAVKGATGDERSGPAVAPVL